MIEFDAEIIAPPDYPRAAYIEFPFDTKEFFGTKSRVQVKGTMDGIHFEGTLSPMGTCHIMGINKPMRDTIHKHPGDTIHIILEKDYSIRTVEIPLDFQSALDNNTQAKDKWETYNYSHKKEVVAWINDCKKTETRERRIVKAIESLSNPPLT
jgi:hypothetical protein